MHISSPYIKPMARLTGEVLKFNPKQMETLKEGIRNEWKKIENKQICWKHVNIAALYL